ncbi:MAG: ABC transporter permease [Deltaproteobacteria bacterium]|nr:ABC transporter permease [Deltaproteobacteria bacterium]
MNSLLQDLGFGLRSLARKPGLALAAIFTLALGIGGNTTIFSTLHAVVLQPMPFESPDKLARIYAVHEDRYGSLSGPEFEYIEEHSEAFEHVAAWLQEERNLTTAGEPESLRVALSTPGLLGILRAEPLLGRGFLAEEGLTGQDRVVLLSEGLWRHRFGADETIVGTDVFLDEESFRVVGVLPEKVKLVVDAADIWIPLVLEGDLLTEPGAHALSVLGRARPQTSLPQAAAEVETLLATFQAGLETDHRPHHTSATSLHEVSVGDVRPQLLLLMAAVAAVLLIACTNIANLLLVRSEHRRKELALRAALGAGRGRLIRQMLTESVVIALLGGVLGLLLASWMSSLVVAFSPDTIPRMDGSSTTAVRSILFTFGLSLITGLVIGLLPAFHASRVDIQDSVKAESGGSTKDRRRSLPRNGLVVAQVALSLVLLVSAGLLLRSFWGLLSLDPGFEPHGAYTVRLHLPDSRYPEFPQEMAFGDQVVKHLEALPWVETAALATPLPLTGSRMRLSAKLDPAKDPDQSRFSANWRSVSPGYFETMKVPLLRGRPILSADNRTDAAPVVVINESMAKHLFPGEDALGQRIQIGYNDLWCEVVGITADVRHDGLSNQAGNEMHTAMAVTPWGGMDVVFRTRSEANLGAAAMSEQVRRVVWELDPLQPVDAPTPMEELVASSVEPQRYLAGLVAGFALVALAMAALGIYGVLSFSVARRTRELGVRLALGERPSGVLRLVLSQGMSLVAIGLVIGLTASWALSRFLSSQLYEINRHDPVTYIAVAAAVTAVSLLANFVPARRAALVDPMVALRHD